MLRRLLEEKVLDVLERNLISARLSRFEIVRLSENITEKILETKISELDEAISSAISSLTIKSED